MKKFLSSDHQGRARAGSLGSLEDQGKRKRNSDLQENKEEFNLFKRSNLIRRSPQKFHEMEEILRKLNDIKDELREIKENNRELKEKYNEILDEVKNTHETFRKENENLKQEIHILKEKFAVLEKKQNWKEKDDKKYNIVITTKLAAKEMEDREEAKKKVTQICANVAGENVGIKNITFITNTKKGLNIIGARVQNHEQKIKIMKNKNKLKDTQTYIDDDLTKEELEIQKQIRVIARKKKQKGFQVRIGYKKICIDGKWRRWEELTKII